MPLSTAKNTPSSWAPSSHASASTFYVHGRSASIEPASFPSWNIQHGPFPSWINQLLPGFCFTYLLMTSMHGTDFDIMQSIVVGSRFGGVWGRVMRWRGLVMTRERGRECGGRGGASANAVSSLSTYASLVHSTV